MPASNRKETISGELAELLEAKRRESSSRSLQRQFANQQYFAESGRCKHDADTSGTLPAHDKHRPHTCVPAMPDTEAMVKGGSTTGQSPDPAN